MMRIVFVPCSRANVKNKVPILGTFGELSKLSRSVFGVKFSWVLRGGNSEDADSQPAVGRDGGEDRVAVCRPRHSFLWRGGTSQGIFRPISSSSSGSPGRPCHVHVAAHARAKSRRRGHAAAGD